MMPRRRSPIQRALRAGAIVALFGIVGAGVPSVAAATVSDELAAVSGPVESAPDPSPTAPPALPTEPAPTEPAPSEVTPTPPEPESPAPAAPVLAPPTLPITAPAPNIPTPVLLGRRQPAPIVSRSPALAPLAAPTFGLVYPTNPWIYNGEQGTRFLDVRESIYSFVPRRHLGIDAQGGIRQPIFAVAAGTVVEGTWGTTTRDGHGFGNQVAISHADGYATRYAHLDEAPLVRLGENVAAGQLVGFMGGSRRGNLNQLARHLHFEVTKDGNYIDPASFLSGATASAPAASAAEPLASPLYETRIQEDGSYTSRPTGVSVSSSVFSAVALGGDSAEIMLSEAGTLKRIAVVGGVWTKIDTLLPLNATSISGVVTDTGPPELLAVEDGKLFHIVSDTGKWTKTWTGHNFSGTVSAVRLPGGQLHALLQQAGHLYHLSPAQGGLWNITDARLEVGEQVDAVYVGGSTPDAMAVIDGQVYRIARGELGWTAEPTGLLASGPVAAVSEDGRWPIAMTVEPGGIGVTRVVNQFWTRYRYGVVAPQFIDAVVIDSAGTVVYSIG